MFLTNCSNLILKLHFYQDHKSLIIVTAKSREMPKHLPQILPAVVRFHTGPMPHPLLWPSIAVRAPQSGQNKSVLRVSTRTSTSRKRCGPLWSLARTHCFRYSPSPSGCKHLPGSPTKPLATIIVSSLRIVFEMYHFDRNAQQTVYYLAKIRYNLREILWINMMLQ